ncbi:MAG: 6-phosphofructokinase [Desulfobacterales bacterium]|nr:6-phosphofructokinase [Desulfobacterales bacterium]
MQTQKKIKIETFLKDPDVQEVIRNVNQDLIERREYTPPMCRAFSGEYTRLEEDATYRFHIDKEARIKLPKIIDSKVQVVERSEALDEPSLKRYRQPRNIGIVFSGGPAPGGHNVIAGLFDAAKKANPDNRIFGFLVGPDGIIENEVIEIDSELVDKYRNLGGFTMIKTGRTKIDSQDKMTFSRETCRKLNLNALVVVGGDDSNTNAAFLAQEMIDDGVQVIGVPKTIDGDIQVRDADNRELCAMSFGFHSAARAFASDISNLCTDCSSDIKYWHICKVMGRVASHLAMEVALQTHANMTLIGEDLANYVDQRRIVKAETEGETDYTAYGMTLRHLSRVICHGIVQRAAVGKNYGVIVLPEGILEFINEIQVFIIKLNTIIANYNRTRDVDFHTAFPMLEDKREYLRRMASLSREGKGSQIWRTRDDDLFNDLPAFFQEGLLTERDSHGNFQFSLVETDKVIMDLVQDYLNILRENGVYKIGIPRVFFRKVLEKDSLDPDIFGPILFHNYSKDDFLLTKPTIISLKTLTQALVDAKALKHDDTIPAPIKKIYLKSVPKFKTQTHFYGYDGRGTDPTRFDCIYTYNLGLTVFSLIANGVSGQMAAIKNLGHEFSEWQPIGIPIGPLMHLEERKGKLSLVIEKSIVDVKSPAFQIVKALRENWLALQPNEDNYRRPGPIRFTGLSEEDRPITLKLNALGKNL